jgi:hypothetical protein
MQGEGLRGHIFVTIDRALELTRRASGDELLRAMVPGGVLSLLALSVYYAERVEGVRFLRPLFALSFALAYMARALVLSRWAGRRSAELLESYRVPKPHGPSAGIARAALWVALDLWFWLWLLVLAVHVDPWLVPLTMLLFALRGALLPSWLACADATEDVSGFRVLRRAIELSEGQRARGIVTELVLLLAAIGVALNLAALGAGIISIGQEMLGLDLSLTNAFLSAKNHFALLFVFTLSLTLLEPLRASLSAVLFTDALLSREGIAVRSLVTRAIEPKTRGSQGAALSVLLLLGLYTAHTEAQELVPGQLADESSEAASGPTSDAEIDDGLVVEGVEEAPAEEPCEGACLRARESDALVQEQAESILADRAFAEFPEEDWSMDAVSENALSEWFTNVFLKWLLGDKDKQDAQPPVDEGKKLSLPAASFFLVTAGIILVLLLLFALRSTRGKDGDASPTTPELEDPLKRPAEAHLDDALSLSTRDLSAALRSLYLATLVGLERRSMLDLSPERTNGQYLRTLPDGDDRRMFAAFTRVFDAVHYGARVPSVDDFRTCRSLAERLIAGGRAP